MEDLKNPAETPKDVENPTHKDEKPAEEPKQPPKEDKAEEPKKPKADEPAEGTVDIESLKAELKEAQEKASEVEALNGTVSSMKAEVEKKDAVIKEYEELIGKMVETKMEQVPEEFKELIPDNLDLKQKLSWLEKAEAKGLFNKEEKKKPNVEIGKPLNVDVPQVDTAKLSGSQLLKMAYNTIKK